MNIGSAIRTIRVQKNINQSYLAEMCNISVNALSEIEKGRTFPSQKIIDKICVALNIPEYYIMINCISEDDLPSDKKILYRVLVEPLKRELLNTSPKLNKI